MLVGTPSGVTLAPEGGAHQSIGTPLVGMSQPGLTAFEPAFADELAIIMEWAFGHLQADDGGSVYLRLSTNPLEQIGPRGKDSFAADVIEGGYWLREPGPNCDVVIAYQGVIAPEAIAAAGMIGNGRRDIGVLAVTSADRLHAGWSAAQKSRAGGRHMAPSQIERLLGNLPGHCSILTVIDGHPATLSWLGGVGGHRVMPCGVEEFGQTGTIGDLYHQFGLDAHAIAARVATLTPGRNLCA